MIRAPKMCRVPDCCGEAIGKCTDGVSWPVCWFHFPLARNNGFAPMTWEELKVRKEAMRIRIAERVSRWQRERRGVRAGGVECKEAAGR